MVNRWVLKGLGNSRRATIRSAGRIGSKPFERKLIPSCKGVLRNIVKIVKEGNISSMHEPYMGRIVRLSCGHRKYSGAACRAWCKKCRLND